MNDTYSAWVSLTIEDFPADNQLGAHQIFHEFLNELAAWLKDGKRSELKIKEVEYPMVLPTE